MKKVLLATSALFLTAGVASAEITFSGTAGAGIFKQGKVAAVEASDDYATALSTAVAKEAAYYASPTAANKKAWDTAAAALAKETAAADAKVAEKDYTVYSGIDIEVKASTTTDNGMTITATTDMGAGSLLDAADRELDAQTDDLTAPSVVISYNGVSVELESEGVDDYVDGDLENYDIGITGAFGGLSFGIALETESKTASDYSATLGYSAAGASLTISQNDVDGAEDRTSVAASYTMAGLTLTLKNDNFGAAKDKNTVSVAYAAGPATISLSATDAKVGKKDEWNASVAYTVGAYTINAATDESDAWHSNVAYDLGGGAKMTVGVDSTETSFAGVSFAF
jgi:hypothetical protein